VVEIESKGDYWEIDLRSTSRQGHILLETLPGGNDSSLRLAQNITYYDVFVVWPMRGFRVRSRDLDFKCYMIHNEGSSPSSIVNMLEERVYYTMV
jgi:hypothetical protein